jgi:hypothetical protein
MTENSQPEGNLKDEFQTFGENLKKAFTSAWESEERAQAQQEIEAGIKELGNALNEFVTSFSASETGQKIIQEVDDFSDRVRSGEVQAKAEEGLLKALKKVNEQLGKAADHFSPKEDN